MLDEFTADELQTGATSISYAATVQVPHLVVARLSRHTWCGAVSHHCSPAGL